MRRFVLLMIAMVALGTTLGAQPPPNEKMRYLRPADKGWATECELKVQKRATGWAIGSTTLRGKIQLTVEAAYDEANGLRSGEVVLKDGVNDRAAVIKKNENKVDVHRAGAEPQALEVPPGVIVTSAPDWTDTVLLCARYRHVDGGKQTFPALWVHPDQAALLLQLTIERQGYDTIRHDGKDLKLARFAIHLRGNSPYAAWATMEGTMVRLIPLPAKEKQRSGLVLQGYEKSAAELSPPAPNP